MSGESRRRKVQRARAAVLEKVAVWRDGVLHPEKYLPNSDDVRLFGLAVAHDELARAEASKPRT